MDCQTLIIGGGAAGLACAWDLTVRKGVAADEVRLREASQRLGGVIETVEQGGCTLETGPDSLIATKPAGTELIKGLGLEELLMGTSPKARQGLIARGRKLVPIPEGLYLMAPGRLIPFAFSPLLSWPGKMRMGLDLILPRRKKNLPEESLAQFVRRRLGREALDRMAQPLIGGIYTADPEQLSLAATMPQFQEMEQQYRSLTLAMRARSKAMAKAGQSQGASGARYGLFLTLKGGLQRLVDGLQRQIPEGVAKTGVTAQEIAPLSRGWQVNMSDGTVTTAANLVLAVPAHVAHRLLKPVHPQLDSVLGGIPYAGIATLNLVFDADAFPALPQAAGFVVPNTGHRSMVACTFSSLKYLGRAPDNKVVLRAFIGGARHEGVLEQDDQSIIDAVVRELDWRFSLRGPVRDHLLTRWPRAMAQYHVGHLRRIDYLERIVNKFPGLHLIGNGYRGVGVPDVVGQGFSVASTITAGAR